jgi:hypothetical protein
MKKVYRVVLIGFLLAYCHPVLAQQTEKKEVKGNLHTVIHLKNGEKAEGYLQNYFTVGGFAVSTSYRIPSALDSVMRIKMDNKMFERSMKYRNQEVDSMITWYDAHPDIKMKWEPRPVDFGFGGNGSVIEDYPAMLLVVYEGNHVKGYLSFYPGFGFKYLFMMGDMPYAKAFLVPNQKFSERRRKTLLDTFYMYPEMEDFIKSLTKNAIKEDPLCILKKLDQLVTEE